MSVSTVPSFSQMFFAPFVISTRTLVSFRDLLVIPPVHPELSLPPASFLRLKTPASMPPTELRKHQLFSFSLVQAPQPFSFPSLMVAGCSLWCGRANLLRPHPLSHDFLWPPPPPTVPCPFTNPRYRKVLCGDRTVDSGTNLPFFWGASCQLLFSSGPLSPPWVSKTHY